MIWFMFISSQATVMTHRKSRRSILHNIEECPVLKCGSLTIQGRSRAAERTGFYIPELKLALDSGMSTYMSIQNLFLTHSHLDHSGNLTRVGGNMAFRVYCPEPAVLPLINMLKSMKHVDECKSCSESSFPFGLVTSVQGLQPKSEIKINQMYTIVSVALTHTVPTLGYILQRRTPKLKEEYKGKTSKELVELKQDPSLHLTEAKTEYVLAYFLDTSIESIEHLHFSGMHVHSRTARKC